jgi:predicted metal-dependent phosphoesterase TrpH
MTPEQVVELAQAKGVTVLALSDHDTVAGVMRAWKRAKELGLEFHPAIEMTARGGVHIGAVDIDITDPRLIAVIERMRAKRLHHMESIVAKLNEHQILKDKGVTITIDEVRAKSKHDEGGTIELPHVARVLVDKGVITEVDRAFDDLLKGDVLDNPGGQPDPTVEEVLEAIQGAGGKAILNHPHTVRGADQRAKDKAVKAILAKGIHAIEVYRPLLPPRNDEDKRRNDQRAAKLLTWMDEFGLLAAPGADFHGTDTHLKHLSVWMPKVLARALLDDLKAVNAAAIAVLERLERSIGRPAPGSV